MLMTDALKYVGDYFYMFQITDTKWRLSTAIRS